MCDKNTEVVKYNNDLFCYLLSKIYEGKAKFPFEFIDVLVLVFSSQNHVGMSVKNIWSQNLIMHRESQRRELCQKLT